MNKAAVAAAAFGVAHFFKRRIGDRNIPPPTPMMPLRNPIPAPNEYASAGRGFVIYCEKVSGFDIKRIAA